MNRIAIVGASLAGVQAAQALRRRHYEGDLVLIGDEPHYPYDRPPLSKEYLAGSMDEDRLRLRPTADPEALGVEWHLDRPATALAVPGEGTDPVRVTLADGDEITADAVMIATGARPRTLPGTEGIGGVHVLRGLDDARAIKAALDRGPDRVVVIGFGFIGAEVAATARQRGLDVTIVEAAPAPLTRVLDEESGRAVAELHRGHGVDVRLGVGVDGVTSADGAVSSVELSDGTSLPTSLVVVGIGVEPNTGWLEGSGLTLDDGVVTDETCLAGPATVAVGDVARWPQRRRGGALVRVEQWDNAVEMGAYGATRLLALAAGELVEPFDPVLWFWSDQYDRKIQLAGAPSSAIELVQGSHAEQRFVQLYLDDDEQVTGALCWNRPRQAIMARQLIAQGAPVADFRGQLS